MAVIERWPDYTPHKLAVIERWPDYTGHRYNFWVSYWGEERSLQLGGGGGRDTFQCT